MPKKFAIIAVDRAHFRDADLHKRLLDGVKRFSRKWEGEKRGLEKFRQAHHLSTGRFQRSGNLLELWKRVARNWIRIGR